MILIRHYFPAIDIDSLSDEEFAMVSQDAVWLHNQMVIEQQAAMLGMFGGGSAK